MKQEINETDQWSLEYTYDAMLSERQKIQPKSGKREFETYSTTFQSNVKLSWKI